MISPSSSRYLLFIIGARILCAGQAERKTAMQWADYYAVVYSVPPELVDSIIGKRLVKLLSTHKVHKVRPWLPDALSYRMNLQGAKTKMD
jgi:hypothetical protein